MDQVPPPDIISAGDADAARVADILADAFSTDPVMNWAMPNTSLYAGFFRMLAEQQFLQHGHVYLDSHERGAAMWLPPDAKFDLPVTLRQLLLMLRLVFTRGFGVLPKLEQLQTLMARHHPREPHFYLQSVGARQSCQGQGIGSALLKQVTPLCDRAGVPAYLESSSERNVPLYERHGFEVFHSEPVGKGGPTMWFMLRAPREN